MKSSIIKLCTLLLIITLLISTIKPLIVSAADNNTTTSQNEISIASKIAEPIDEKEGRYKVTVSVPGEQTEILHDEIIIMLDASDSQGSN